MSVQASVVPTHDPQAARARPAADWDAVAHTIALGRPVQGVSFHAMALQGRALAGAVFEDCDFGAADFSRCDLGRCTFLTCDLTDADLRAAQAINTRFIRCAMPGVRMPAGVVPGLALIDCDLRASVWAGTHLQRSAASGCDLRDAAMHGVRLERTVLWKPQLDGADLGDAVFDQVALCETDLRRTVLHRIRAVLSALLKNDLRGQGLVVHAVAEGSVAERLGLQRYDVLLKLHGREIRGPADVAAALKDRKPDDPLSATVIRRGTPLDLR